MAVQVDEEGPETAQVQINLGGDLRANVRPRLRGFCSGRSMFGGCRESGPNRFVRFVKGIWGVTTLSIPALRYWQSTGCLHRRGIP